MLSSTSRREPGAADVPLVEEDPLDDPFDRLVERRVREDDVRRFPAELQGEPLLRPGERALDALADLGAPGERDLVDVGVARERRARLPRSGDDVDDARRELGLLEDLREQQRRQRRRLGGLEHDGVPARERRRDLPRGHEQREVPRDDLPGDAERPRTSAVEGVVELVRPPA